MFVPEATSSAPGVLRGSNMCRKHSDKLALDRRRYARGGAERRPRTRLDERQTAIRQSLGHTATAHGHPLSGSDHRQIQRILGGTALFGKDVENQFLAR